MDELTGLPGRPALEEAVRAGLARGSDFALALMDVDHFSSINEEAGHEAGDRVLATLGEVLKSAGIGEPYRVSGDEFAVLFPGTSLEQAFLQVERLRERVETERERFVLPAGKTVSVTAGVAAYPRDAKDLQSLMRAADAALMAAKEAGRNQVGLPPNEEMVMKSCYYSSGSLRKLKELAARLKRKESVLLREALADLLRKYDEP